LVAFFVAAGFFAADFGFDVFLAAAGFFVPVDLAFFAVVAFLAAGLGTFFVAVFLAPPALAALVFFVLVCFVAFDFVAAADFVVALDFGFDDLVIITFLV